MENWKEGFPFNRCMWNKDASVPGGLPGCMQKANLAAT